MSLAGLDRMALLIQTAKFAKFAKDGLLWNVMERWYCVRSSPFLSWLYFANLANLAVKQSVPGGSPLRSLRFTRRQSTEPKRR